jgi:membrane-bound ClpP family serine protease
MGRKLDIFTFIILLISFPVILTALYNQNWTTVAINGGILILLTITISSPKVEKKGEKNGNIGRT